MFLSPSPQRIQWPSLGLAQNVLQSKRLEKQKTFQLLFFLLQDGQRGFFGVSELLHELSVQRLLGRARFLLALHVLNFQRKQLGYGVLNLVGNLELDIGAQIVRASLINVFDAVALLAFTALDLDLRNSIAHLRLVTRIAFGHPLSQDAVRDLIGVLVVISQGLADHVLLQRELVAQDLLQRFGHKRLRLANVSVFHQDIQRTPKHFLDDGCIITTLENDAHGLAFGLDGRVIFLHHTDLALATEQNERIERLFLANDLRLAALLGDAICSLHAELNAFCDVLCGEPNEDRVRVSLDDIRSELLFHDLLGKQQLLASRSRGGCRDTQPTNGRRTASRLALHGVGNDLVGQLKAIENRLLPFVRESFCKLAGFLAFFQQDVQHERENALAEIVLIGLGVGARRAAQDVAFVVLVFIANVVQGLARLEFTQSICLEPPTTEKLPFRRLGALAHEGIGRDVVSNHVRRLERVEIQNTDGLIQVHVDLGLNHDGTLLRPIFRIKFTPRLGAQDLIALAGNGGNRGEDLDTLSTEKDPAHGHLTDLRHTPRIDNRVQLGHEREHEIAVLNTVARNASTLCRALTMQSEEFLCTDIVLRKRPFQIFGSRSEHILGQHKVVGTHLFHNDFVSLRICRVAHNLETHVVLGTQTTGALGVDLATLHPADLVAQEDRCHAIKLEALQRVLAAHVQQKINAQTTRGIPVAEVVLARCQLEGLGNEMAGLLSGHASELNFVFDPQHFAAIHELTVVKAEGVLSADDVGILFTNVVAEGQDHLFFRSTGHELLVSLYAAQHEHAALQRLQQIARASKTDTNLNDRVTLLGNFPEGCQVFGVAFFQCVLHPRHSEKSRDLCSRHRDLLLSHALLQDLGQGPILRSLLYIATCALKERNPLLLGPYTLGHRKLSVT